MKTITDYNKEFCEFNELNDIQKCIILREDTIRLIEECNYVTLCETEMYVIIENQIVFSDLLDFTNITEKYDEFSEDVSYIIKKK